MSSSDKVVTCNGLSSTRSSPLELEDRNAEAPVQALLAQGFHQGKGKRMHRFQNREPQRAAVFSDNLTEDSNRRRSDIHDVAGHAAQRRHKPTC